MDEIIRKIDEEINESHHYGCESEYRAGLYKAKELIQAEQNKPKTKGDAIRESNFKLANTIHQVTDCKKCLVKDGCEVTNQFACYGRWYDYLNQPVEEE